MQQLQEAIFLRKYKPGDRLNESSLAREYKVSRIPVREALFQLRELGLVMLRERRGMFVTSLTEDEYQQITSVRILLETEAFTLARKNLTPKTKQALTDMVARMDSVRCSLSDAAALDLKFHRTIWEISGNPYLLKVLDPLATLLFAHHTLERTAPGQVGWRLNHHRSLLDALTAARKPDVKAALLQHTAQAYIKIASAGEQAAPAKKARNTVSKRS